MIEVKELQGLKVFESPASNGAPTVILLHGYGANGQDLIPCAEFFREGHAYRWLFPEAPIELGGRAYSRSCAWFDIDVQGLALAAQAGSDVTAFDSATFKQADDEAERLADLFRELELVPERTVLGGFSQGSMMALLTAAKLDVPLAGLLLFSSASVFPDAFWGDRVGALKHKPRIFQSHGRYDPVLAYASSGKLRGQLAKAGYVVSNVEFPGGHELPPSVLEKADAFTRKCFEAATSGAARPA